MKNKKYLVIFIVLISIIAVNGFVREQSLKYQEERSNKTMTNIEIQVPFE